MAVHDVPIADVGGVHSTVSVVLNRYARCHDATRRSRPVFAGARGRSLGQRPDNAKHRDRGEQCADECKSHVWSEPPLTDPSSPARTRTRTIVTLAIRRVAGSRPVQRGVGRHLYGVRDGVRPLLSCCPQPIETPALATPHLSGRDYLSFICTHEDATQVRNRRSDTADHTVASIWLSLPAR